VPRIYEKVHSKIISGAEAKGGLALKIFRWACAVGTEVSGLKQRKQPVPTLLNLKYKLATKLVFSKVHAALGGRVRWCISGAAPLNPDIGRFFHAAGVLILEGIGMTENTSFTTSTGSTTSASAGSASPAPASSRRSTPTVRSSTAAAT